MIITPELIVEIKKQYRLDWHGIHGVSHWARVRNNGLRLAEKTGANAKVVELFAFIHDSGRLNDYFDPEHGLRAANFARALLGHVINLADEELQLLTYACEFHSDGHQEADITILTCWDADRLDLGRVGIIPVPEKLCTSAARDSAMIDFALKSSHLYSSSSKKIGARVTI